MELSLPLPKYRLAEVGSGSAADAVAPMPGVVDKVFVKPGDTVDEGQPVLVMIAMKMEVSEFAYYFQLAWLSHRNVYVLARKKGIPSISDQTVLDVAVSGAHYQPAGGLGVNGLLH